MTNEEIAKIDFSDWPISDNYLVEVGRVALFKHVDANTKRKQIEFARSMSLQVSRDWVPFDHQRSDQA